MNVPRSQVASIMKDIDLEGVQQRRSRQLRRRAYVSYGPNFCWHVDHRCKFGYKSHYSSGQFFLQEEQNIFKIEREKAWPSSDCDLAQTFPATMPAHDTLFYFCSNFCLFAATFYFCSNFVLFCSKFFFLQQVFLYSNFFLYVA